MRLLIVDDDDLVCMGVQMRIREMDFRVLTHIDVAFSAEEALDYIRTWGVDILLTDIQMVNMNGLDLIAETKNISHDVSVLILTAYASFDYAQKAIQLGVHGFLLKPFSKETMYQELSKVIISAEKAHRVLNEQDQQDKNPINWAKDYVRNNLDTEINMAYVANRLNFSYAYFSKLFKQSTGMTFSNYILQVKMEEAMRLLNKGEKVGNIANGLGYPILQNFDRAFQRYWGCTPSEYRHKKISKR